MSSSLSALRSVLLSSVLAALSACNGAHGPAGRDDQGHNAFRDPLQTAAQRVSGAAALDHQPIICVSQAGKRLVAAGLRGLVLLSDDGGSSWRQAKVPVSSDLLALNFPTSQQGWAVGHDGVILHSSDGGENWSKQLDGTMSASSLPAYYQKRIAAGETALQPFLDQVLLNTKDGPVLPYLSVYFEDDKTGYVAGSFGMLLATTDGGSSWQPALERIDNKDFFNLNDIRRVGSEVYIAGERGTVYRYDAAASRFIAVPTEYQGSFFGVTGAQDYVIVFGLGGNAYRSTDRGASWQPVDTGTQASLTAGAVTPSDDAALVLVSGRGQLAVSRDQGRSFSEIKVSAPMLYSSVIATDPAKLILAGLQGVQIQTLQPPVTAASLDGRH